MAFAGQAETFRYLKYKLGENIYVTTEGTQTYKNSSGVEQFYDWSYRIRSIEGSGDMFPTTDELSTSAVAWGSNNGVDWEEAYFMSTKRQTWGFFKAAHSTQVTHQVGIDYNVGLVEIPGTIRKITPRFLADCWINNIILHEGIEVIGYDAFYSPVVRIIISEGTTKTTKYVGNLITEITIPSTVTSIGYRAFAKANFLSKITFLNENYVLKGYSDQRVSYNIFYVRKNDGAELDDNGNFITEVNGGLGVTSFNWLTCNRTLKPTNISYIYVYSEAKKKILKLPVFRDIGEVPIWFEHLGMIVHLKLVPLDDKNASPVRVKTCSGIKAVSYK